MEADDTLGPVRRAFAQATAQPATIAKLLTANGPALSTAFILPGLPHGGSGGSHSVYQEVKALRELGFPASIALPRWDMDRARAAYPDADEVFRAFADDDELEAATADVDIISATHYKSVALLQALRERRDDFLPAYYVQDYEPFFTAPYIAEEAIASYTAVPDMLLFAKSHWLCNVVAERHGLLVAKVEPSLDDQLFRASEPPLNDGPLKVAAMIRPRTARRQPFETVRVLERLLKDQPGGVEVITFGCYTDELREIAPDATPIIQRHRGLLTRPDVAEVLRSSDVFLDMSLYQAFGRTALEAMACGATTVVPAIGGVWEFIEDRRNGLAVDTLDPEAAFHALASLAADRSTLSELKTAARETARRYSASRAALSEYLTFERAHRIRQARATRITV
jgi:glycosyltransferase involved in cell wall biosynthesis